MRKLLMISVLFCAIACQSPESHTNYGDSTSSEKENTINSNPGPTSDGSASGTGLDNSHPDSTQMR